MCRQAAVAVGMTAVRLDLRMEVFGTFLEFGKVGGFSFLKKLERVEIIFRSSVSERSARS